MRLLVIPDDLLLDLGLIAFPAAGRQGGQQVLGGLTRLKAPPDALCDTLIRRVLLLAQPLEQGLVPAAGGQLVAGCGPAGAPGALEPLIGKRGVAPDAAAMAIHHAEAVVGLGVTEARRLRVEQGGLLGGAGHAQPIQRRASQARPRPRVPQLRRTLEGRQRRRRIGLAAQTIQQRLPQTVFGRAVR